MTSEVVRAVLVANGKILVCQRQMDTYEGGKWCLPGGTAKTNNLLREVRREVVEDLGVYAGGLRFLVNVNKGEVNQTYYFGHIGPLQVANARSLYNMNENILIDFVDTADGKQFAFGDGAIVDYVLSKPELRFRQ